MQNLTLLNFKIVLVSLEECRALWIALQVPPENCEEFFDLDEVSAVSPGADLAKPTGKISCAVVLRAR